MPFIIPFIPLIAAGVTAGTSLGLTLSNQPGSAPQIPTGPTTPQPQGTTTDMAQKAAVASSLPNLQSLTGGSLSPEYASQWVGLNTGLGNNPQAGGNIQSAINQFFGFASPGNTGLSSTGPTGNSITDLLSRVGATSGTPTGGGGGSFIDSLLQSDSLRGFA